MADKLHIDIETYSSVDIGSAGHYKYIESPDFEILILCYALNGEPEVEIDMYKLTRERSSSIKSEDFWELNDTYESFLELYNDPTIEKWAHNATFERNCFRRIGLERPIEEWYCSAIKAAYCGYPLSLADVSKAMGLGDKAKLSSGKALIRYFSMPCRPTKKNEGRTRNLPEHDPEKWQEFIEYCAMDVEAEREIDKRLEAHEIPEWERRMYILDQEINDRGIMIDTDMAATACEIVDKNEERLGGRIQEITGIDNPNSGTQLRKWLSGAMKKQVKSLAKDVLPTLIEEAESPAVKEVLQLRTKSSKTSNKKYQAMLNCVGKDGRGRGFFQHYGATRTGRWAGRIVQLQNLPRNYLKDMAQAKEIYKTGDYDLIGMCYDNIPDVLSQLIRTAFIAKPGHTFAVADFSAIEARVIAWLAGEKWRMDVFNSHGKIYEASASMMFGVPIEEVTKGSEWRQKGKIAELALGYQGSVGAMKTMGAEEEGLTEEEMKDIVTRWREKSPMIVKLWKAVENAAKEAFRTGKTLVLPKFQNLKFGYDGHFLVIELPSGRRLYYVKPKFSENRFGQQSVKYQGRDQTTGKWGWIESYGGKFVENCLAADTKVVTLNGIKDITSVTADDSLWDGVEWVHSEGVISKGINETIDINGVRMTADHKILTENGWKDASQSEGLNRAEVQLPDSYSLRGVEWEEIPMEGSLRMWNGEGDRSFRTKEAQDQILRMQEKRSYRKKQSDSRKVKPPRLRSVAVNARQMQTPLSSSVAQLRGEGNQSVQKVGEVREFLEGHGAYVSRRIDFGAEECEWQLSEEQLHLGHLQNSSSEQEEEYSNKHKMGLHNSGRSFGEIRGRGDNNPLSAEERMEGRRFTRKAGLHEQVYDILNAGPRHRFTVIDENGEPFIVHNCVQAVARDLLVEAMLALDAANIDIVMHVHDEAVAEVPLNDAEWYLEKMEEIMGEDISWAKGLPLKADGYITPFYMKD